MDKALNYSLCSIHVCCYLNNNKHATEQLERKKESKAKQSKAKLKIV
jgi:hypothetical protein